MPEVTIIGLHPLDYTGEVFDQAVTARHGLIALNPDREKRELADHSTRAALGSIVLVEMLIRNRDKSMYMGDFGQTAGNGLGPDDPVAYEEAFLSLDGQTRTADYLDQVKGPDVRFAFYLHDYRSGLPIQTSYGPVHPPPLTAMPARLKLLVPYRLPEIDEGRLPLFRMNGNGEPG